MSSTPSSIEPGPAIDWASLVNQQQKPVGKRPVMKQTWHDLLFIHFEVDPEWIQSLLPPGLQLDIYHGRSFLGFVPFRMSGISPFGLPPIPGLSSFAETNLRTYVRHPQHGPGVWFFSLDATQYLGCLIARTLFQLPYYRMEAHIRHLRSDSRDLAIEYKGTLHSRQLLPAVWRSKREDLPLWSNQTRVQIRPEESLAAPESLDFWLHERYRLYAADRDGNLRTARVWHEPYRIQEAQLESFSWQWDSNISNSSIEDLKTSEPVRVTYSKRVDVLAYHPQKVMGIL